MPRARRPLRDLTALAILIVLAGLSAGPVAGRGSAADPDGAASPAIERVGAREVETRGPVDVAAIGESVDAGSAVEFDGTVSPGSPGPGVVPHLAATDPVQSSTSATDPPTLGSGLQITRDASTPAPMIAVGPDHLIRSDESSFLISDRTGANAVSISYEDLFILPDGVSPVSARIWFEPSRSRWVAVEASRDCSAAGPATYGHGYLDFAISDGADPTSGWTVHFLTTDDAIVSSPRLGTSMDKLVVSSRLQPMTTGCAASGADLWDLTSLDWADMVSGGEDDAAYFTFADAADGVIDWLAPAIQQPATANTAFVVVQQHVTAGDQDHTLVLKVTGSNANTIVSDSDDLTGLDIIDALGMPSAVPQGAGSFQPSSIPTSVIWRSGRLVIAHTEDCTPAGDASTRACARIVDLTTSGSTPARRQDFYLAADGQNTSNPGAVFTADGQLLVAYDRSTPSAGPSAYVVRQLASDAAGTVSPSAVLAAATGLYRQPNGPGMVGLAPDPQIADGAWVLGVVGTADAGEADPDYDVRTALARTFGGATFETIAPARVLDTRTDMGLPGPFVSNAPRSFQVAGVGAIPSGAIAITANVTVAGQTGGGYVALTPTATTTPTSSTLNFPVGDNRANNVTVPLDPAGKLAAVYKSSSNRTTELIVDVTGYFVADSTGSTYEPIAPVRLLDSRVGIGASSGFNANVPKTVQITGNGGIPAGAKAITGNLTVTGQSRGGYVSVTPTPNANPATSTINFPSGDTRANGLTIPLSAGGSLAAVYKTSSGSTHLILDVTGYYVDGASGLRFYPLQPGRILDTRATTLTLLTGKLTSSSAKTLPVGGHFGVPETAEAVTGNLTVTGQSKGGYVSITRTKTNSPSVSTINFPSGDTRANGVTVPLDGNDDVHLVYKSSSGATTHLLLDITGYFR